PHSNSRNGQSPFRPVPSLTWRARRKNEARVQLLRATQILAGMGHSRTLYTSHALEQSKIIII
ncbi:MAG TPA: hypothetical protein VLZ30_02720, partial [Verrucomicrobiae bacterium]|nr:hypothetical protein [Verrucomicrobiae bacterium]